MKELLSIDLPRAWLEEGSFHFSFSGLKSAVINTLHNAAQRGITIDPKDMAASFQQSVVEVLVEKTVRASEKYQAKQVLLSGGVAANKGLRTAMEVAFKKKKGIDLVIPPLSLCTDNAAMIAAFADVLYEKGIFGDYRMNAHPGLELTSYI
ncbi:tRNA A37 threonylcarbamoyltransferase TsaD [Aeribacillus sp. SP014]